MDCGFCLLLCACLIPIYFVCRLRHLDARSRTWQGGEGQVDSPILRAFFLSTNAPNIHILTIKEKQYHFTFLKIQWMVPLRKKRSSNEGGGTKKWVEEESTSLSNYYFVAPYHHFQLRSFIITPKGCVPACVVVRVGWSVSSAWLHAGNFLVSINMR